MQKSDILATIDDLNQYLLNNVTQEGLIDSLTELLNKLKNTN
jgi:hypothetical protein